MEMAISYEQGTPVDESLHVHSAGGQIGRVSCSDQSNVYHRFSEEHIVDFRSNIYTHLASARAPAPRLRLFFYITLESRVE